MEKHNTNAQLVAEFLESHTKVKKVYYPGLRSFLGHKLAKEQMSGFGAMMGVELDIDNDQLDLSMKESGLWGKVRTNGSCSDNDDEGKGGDVPVWRAAWPGPGFPAHGGQLSVQSADCRTVGGRV